jgi:hypothetical protein
VVALDHCGMHDVVQPPYGIRVAISDYVTTVQQIAHVLQGLADAPESLERMARSCAAECERFRLRHRASVFLSAYDSAIERYHRRTMAS